MMNKKSLLARKVNKDQELKKLAILSDRDLFLNLRTSLQGLSEEDAQSRLEEYGPNEVSAQKPTPGILLFLQAFNDPFVYVLAALAIVSLLTNDIEAAVVMTIMILASVLITFIQEYRSQKASIELKEMIENTAAITRNGETKEIPMDEVVPGDILTLATGDMIPADAVLIWTKDLFVNQSSLTGESMPVEKFLVKDKELTEEAKRDLKVSLIVLKYTQSNSVCFVKDGQAIGVGAGQQSRVHCTRLAGQKADNWFLRQSPQVLNLPFKEGISRAERDNAIDVYIGEEYMDVLADGAWERIFAEKPEVFTREAKRALMYQLTDVTLGSDAFFPFSDNIERAHKSGVKYIAQPGGSVRDEDVIATCDKYGMAMAFTGIRLFHH